MTRKKTYKIQGIDLVLLHLAKLETPPIEKKLHQQKKKTNLVIQSDLFGMVKRPF